MLTHIHSNTDQYLSIRTIHTICTIQTNTTYKYQPIQTIAYNTYTYIQIQTIHVNTHGYISKQTNTYQYVQCIQIHINTDQYLHISNISTCQWYWQYIPILAIHTENNTYHYVPQYIPCQYMPIHSTIQYIRIHTVKSNTCKYAQITSLISYPWSDARL